MKAQTLGKLGSRVAFLLLSLMAIGTLAACGTLEIRLERTATPIVIVVTVAPSPTVTREPTATQAAALPTPTSTASPTAGATESDPTPTPEPTPAPVSGCASLRLAYVEDGDIWLWTEGQGPVEIAQTASVSDVKISPDGEIVAFVWEGELWMVRSDGTDWRPLVSKADLSNVEPREPFEFPVTLYGFAWVPGTHTVAYNTRLHTQIGLVLNDDLNLIDAETMEQTTLLPPGSGGEFYPSPDGRQIAIATTGTVDLIDLDGSNRLTMLTYTPPVTYSEFRYYAQPVWAADSGSLRVAIPPVDPIAQPTRPTSIWRLHTDGKPAWLEGEITAAPQGPYAFAPDLRHIAYLAPAEGALPGGEQVLHVTNLERGTMTTSEQARDVYGWSPDSQRLAFASNTQPPHVRIRDLGAASSIPAQADASTLSLNARWVNDSRFLFTAQNPEGWSILLGDLGGVDMDNTIVASVTGRQPIYDACLPVTER